MIIEDRGFVICINSNEFSSLTMGKSYELVQTVRYSIPEVYQIIDDSGELAWYSADWLRRVDKIREEKLNQIGI